MLLALITKTSLAPSSFFVIELATVSSYKIIHRKSIDCEAIMLICCLITNYHVWRGCQGCAAPLCGMPLTPSALHMIIIFQAAMSMKKHFILRTKPHNYSNFWLLFTESSLKKHILYAIIPPTDYGERK